MVDRKRITVDFQMNELEEFEVDVLIGALESFPDSFEISEHFYKKGPVTQAKSAALNYIESVGLVATVSNHKEKTTFVMPTYIGEQVAKKYKEGVLKAIPNHWDQ